MPRGMGRAPVYDTNKGTVRIWSKEGRVPKKLLDLLNDDVAREIASHSDKVGLPADGTPALVDFYVRNGAPTNGDIRRGHRMGCEYGAIDLPRQHAWLRGKVAAAVNAGNDVAIWLG